MARILLVDDDCDFSAAMQSMLNAEGHEVQTADSAADAKASLARDSFEFLFVDLSLPDGSGLELIRKGGPKAVIITGHPSVKSAIRAVKGPVIDYLVKPVDKTQLLACIAEASNGASDGGAKPKAGASSELVGESRAMRKLLEVIADFGPTDEPILILGESGTGKDLIARQVHAMRPAEGPFVPVNCGAIPRELIASELFGHEKGSFTGATGQRKGVFERASGGTVFLDEVGELPLDHQVALLRVLENRSIVRVGGDAEIPIQVKIIAATNRDPAGAVKEGKLREDLYFRLRVFPIALPPLRERLEDLPVLVDRFL
ncbi:MAG: sigma-54 dependent transcriptional regulator, partial [Xanthomonadales bacterium]|nr:sigma-54 dependent transcriptional regulator [Xanthomonadales bacterium]